MAENAARVAWAGAGLMLPWRLTGAALAALGGAARSWATRRFAERAGEIAAWARQNDGAERGAELVEQLAG